jgi:hypothetical protein
MSKGPVPVWPRFVLNVLEREVRAALPPSFGGGRVTWEPARFTDRQCSPVIKVVGESVALVIWAKKIRQRRRWKWAKDHGVAVAKLRSCFPDAQFYVQQQQRKRD